MGMFSWMYADTNNKESLKVHKKAYVLCPNGDIIEEKHYNGYGIFNGYDIFDLVADWNKDYISADNIEKPLRENYGVGEDGTKWFEFAVERYKTACQKITDFANGKSDEYMTKKYGEEWKREIGIDIACYDEDNENLKYPIKICKDKVGKFNSVPASASDPNQGWD